LKDMLNTGKIAFVETKNLVRGLDYYDNTVFEVITDEKKSQNCHSYIYQYYSNSDIFSLLNTSIYIIFKPTSF
ncbi:MAG: hypothetical protein ACFE8N_11490, partial [Promethearchaeota archaeon]